MAATDGNLKATEMTLVESVDTDLRLQSFHLGAGGTAGTMVNGTFGTGRKRIEGQIANVSSATTEISVECILPTTYEPGAAITMLENVRLSADVATAKTIDMEVYKLGSDGEASGGDLCATASQSITTTDAAYSFTITPSGLNPGERLMKIIRIFLNDSGGSSGDKKPYFTRSRVRTNTRGGLPLI